MSPANGKFPMETLLGKKPVVAGEIEFDYQNKSKILITFRII